MESITKLKDKKTGQVYDLGPKTWEITLTEEQYSLFTNGDEDGNRNIPVEEIEGAADIEQFAKSGDIILMHACMEGMFMDSAILINTAFHIEGLDNVMSAPFIHGMGFIDVMMVQGGYVMGIELMG